MNIEQRFIMGLPKWVTTINTITYHLLSILTVGFINRYLLNRFITNVTDHYNKKYLLEILTSKYGFNRLHFSERIGKTLEFTLASNTVIAMLSTGEIEVKLGYNGPVLIELWSGKNSKTHQGIIKILKEKYVEHCNNQDRFIKKAEAESV